MATRLLPPEGEPGLSANEIIRRLRGEFTSVQTDAEEGRDHFGSMIETFVRLKAPQAIIDRHLELQESAVHVSVSDEPADENALFEFVASDGGEVFISYHSAQHQQAARGLVERCRKILGYKWMDQ